MYSHPQVAYHHTSQSSPLRIDTVDRIPGAIGLTICPGKKGLSWTGQTLWDRDLSIDVAALSAWGARHVVCLLEPKEFSLLSVAQLPDAVERANMIWHHAPITDGAAPDNRFGLVWSELRTELVAAIEAGENVVIHCRGGLGRSGTVAAALIKTLRPERPMSWIVEQIRQARAGSIESEAQENWLVASHPEEGRPFAPKYSYVVENYVRLCHDYRAVVAQDGNAPPSQKQNALLDDIEHEWSGMSDDARSSAREILNAVSSQPRPLGRAVSPGPSR